MKYTKDTFVFGFALFAGFFGAGNLILPPMLGFNSGPDWWLVALGFVLSAVLIPMLALFGHARLQGTMLDFGKTVSPVFSLFYCLCVYGIAIALPAPRTAAVTHEIAIQPFFGSDPLITSSIYFSLVFLFVLNRTNVLQILGKFLTPLIAIILMVIIFIGIFSQPATLRPSEIQSPLINGLMEGYQTYDALAGILMGGIVVISLNLKGYKSFQQKKKIIARSGLIAALGLLMIYAGLIALGSFFNSQFETGISRTDLLNGLSKATLGQVGTTFLSVLVSLACFTTAVSIIVGTADFFKGLFNESKSVYILAGLGSCILGVLMGQMEVHYIIEVAVPALMFIYPLTIVLILMNVLNERWRNKIAFRAVVIVTFLFSIPDFMGALVQHDTLNTIKGYLPLAEDNLTWVIPAVITFLIFNFKNFKRPVKA